MDWIMPSGIIQSLFTDFGELRGLLERKIVFEIFCGPLMYLVIFIGLESHLVN